MKGVPPVGNASAAKPSAGPNWARALWRLLRAVCHALHGLWIIKTRFGGLSEAQRGLIVQAWAQKMLAVGGISLEVDGRLAPGPLLLVANHVSWLDILVIHAAGYCRFISKADVKSWPLIGTLAAGAGTLFIERTSRRDAHRVVHHMVTRLAHGDVLAVFPEGTTGDGLKLQTFHANLIQAAISADVPVQPLALRYVDGPSGSISHAPRYDNSLLSSVWCTFAAHGLVARVSYGVHERALGRDRRRWARDLQGEVEALLR
jgi:1-acyl-sn-glycerol-3-phosphate acyltransferase